LSLALLIVGLLWLGVLGGGAVARAQVLAFTEVPGSPFVVDPSISPGPHDASFSPNGSLLAIVNNSSSTLSMFKVGADGTLTAVPGSPFSFDGMIFPNSVAFSPSGGLLAVVNIAAATRTDVSVFSVGADGVPHEVTGSPFRTNATAAAYWGAFSPNGEWFAVANRTSNNMSVFHVGSGGALTEIPGSPFATGGLQTNAVAFSPNGRWLATGNINTNNVSVFDVDQTDGTPTPVAGSPFSTGVGNESAWGVAFSPDSGLLATANASTGSATAGGVSLFHVDPMSGALTAVVGSPFPTGSGTGPRGVEFSPGGTLLATANFLLPTASLFSVGPDGELTEVPGSPFPAGPGAKHVSFSPSGDLYTTVNYDSNTISVFRVVGVEITKKARSSVDPGGVVSYTLTIHNPQAVEVDGVVRDNLAGVLAKARLMGTPEASKGTVSVEDGILKWNDTLDPGETVTIHYSVRVRRSARGLLHDSMTGPPDSTCTSNVGGMLGPECVVETQIVPPPGKADLAVTKTVSADTVHPGGQLVYTLTVHNYGPANATGVTLEDPAPPGLSLNSAQASQGSCTVTPGELVRCSLGDLPAGGEVLVLVTATVPLDATGELVNAASVFGAQGDRNPANNIARARVRVVPLPPPPTPEPGPQPFSDLVITKHVNHARALVGQRLTYTITVVNRRLGDAAADVRMTDSSRLRLKIDSIRPSQGSCRTGPPFRCSLGTVRPGGRVTIKITATARRAGRQINAAAVTTSSWQANPRIARAVTVVRRRPPPPPPPRVTG
jgi:uncharacterized repeat protein (TIGR01451 family)